MRRIKFRSLYIAALLTLPLFAACASVMNPYEESFGCPKTQNGKCVSIEEAYRESLEGASNEQSEVMDKAQTNHEIRATNQVDDWLEDEWDSDGWEEEKPSRKTAIVKEVPVLNYAEALYIEMTKLIREPVTPMVTPPKIMRVLLLPYKGKDRELFMYRYIYFMVDEPSWIMDGYLNPGKED